MKQIFEKVKKEPITAKELVVIFITLFAVAFLSVITEQWHKDTIKIFGFLFMLGTIVYLRKYFFPFVFASIACYLMAAAQVLWDPEYRDLRITNILWFCGDVLLPIGFFHFIHRLINKYEIVLKK